MIVYAIIMLMIYLDADELRFDFWMDLEITRDFYSLNFLHLIKLKEE